MIDLSQLDFTSTIRDVRKGLIVKPILENYLFDAEFDSFDLHVEGMGKRKPDGWFHPSTHPLWPEGRLYHYLANPDLMVVEHREYMETLSLLVGTVMHKLFQMFLTDAGLRPAALQVCQMCPPKQKCPEFGLVDSEVGERGHVDGLLDLSNLSVPLETEGAIWEFKTTNSLRMRKIEDLQLDQFRTMWPDYYAQQQSYMRMRGARMSIVTFVCLGMPTWPIREIHVPFDKAFAYGVRDKYRSVREAVEKGQEMPNRWCCGAPTKCEARKACVVMR